MSGGTFGRIFGGDRGGNFNARRWRAGSGTAVAVAFVVAFALWLGLLAIHARRTGDRFDFARWEVTTVANKWLFAIGAPLRSDPPADEAVARYFALADRGGPEARELENVVEAAIEGRLDAVLRDQGVEGFLPLPGPLAVWPPVDIEIARPPRVLIVSPRARVERERTRVLRPDLSPEEALAIEAEAEAEAEDRSLSALVVSTGGFSTYPAVISDRRSYAGTVEVAAHEWTHHYLAFFPLGWRALSDNEALTINETVADIVAEELARLVLARFGDSTVAGGDPPPAASPAASPPAPAVDRAAVLRQLRLEVDSLLAEGRVEEAERRMEEVRLELWDAGARIRRINQAYFAWFGTYAARADAVDPLGPQLRRLREQAGSLAGFLERVRDADTREEVEALLERAGG